MLDLEAVDGVSGEGSHQLPETPPLLCRHTPCPGFHDDDDHDNDDYDDDDHADDDHYNSRNQEQGNTCTSFPSKPQPAQRGSSTCGQ